MSDVEHGRVGRSERVLAAVGLLAALFVSCSAPEIVEVSAAAPPPPAAASSGPADVPEPGPTESFQGAVASIDRAANELVVDVQIVWTPVLRAERHERRVAAGPQTRWEPAGTGLALLNTGDEVQVEAVGEAGGTWQARRIQLFDID